jgi:two-component system response regulator HydG
MMITGYATVEGAVEAVKTGAVEYLSKPFTDEELFSAVHRVLEKQHMRKIQEQKLSKEPSTKYGLIGQSMAMQKVFDSIARAASTSATILITGESGTGKELVARAIHYSSGRSSAPFVPINCGAIPQELFESELFGHVKGAFTGAGDSRAGFFQTADGGTIFLDEIGEMRLAFQVKLLRVLQDKEVFMVGSTKPRKVDVRILAATNMDLPNLVKKGAFREDLFFRISVISIEVPPLRQRGDDIMLLVRNFAQKFARESDRPVPRFSDDALQTLKSYSWPGNVRELENVIQRAIVMTDANTVDVPDLPANMRFTAPHGIGLQRTLAEVEAEHIRHVMASVNGNKTTAAKILGIDRKTLREKLKHHSSPS